MDIRYSLYNARIRIKKTLKSLNLLLSPPQKFLIGEKLKIELKKFALKSEIHKFSKKDLWIKM